MWCDPFKNVSNYFQLDDNDMLYDHYIEDQKMSLMQGKYNTFYKYLRTQLQPLFK